MKNIFYFMSMISFSVISQTIEPSKATEKNVLSIETELFYSKNKEAGVTTKSWNVFNGLIRYGLSEKLEVNMALSNVKEEIDIALNVEEHHHKFNAVKLGTLFNLNNINSINSELALEMDLVLPFDQWHVNANNLGYIVGLNLGTTLTNKWILNSNVAYFKEVDKTDNFIYRFNLQYLINDNLLIFTENTGNKNIDFDWTQSVGLGYYSSHWAFETVIGSGYKSPDFFIGCKIIKDFNLKKKAINK